ncbi:hypothetical protein GLW05_08500 [Pontibacillus yanchengensis]|uniref:SLH domain-containing protein n=1 Tax=Pontibacillus yanchengensis TaxID=462910 RepID=A0A6I4ZXR0_9BACI|nr:hypothetical protein [Pontibacillus yanchengensis]
MGLYKGYSNRQFAPKDVAKRNQAAAVLHRLKNVLK